MSDENLSWLKPDRAFIRRRREGLSPAELLDMPEETRKLMTHIMRHEPVTPGEVAEALGRDALEVEAHLQLLAVQGWLQTERRGDEQVYSVRLDRSRRRTLPPGIWQVLEDRWQVSIFRVLSGDLLEEFIHRFSLCRYAPGNYLFRAGEWGDKMFVVEDGVVELVVRSIQDEATVVRQARAGEVVGEMAVLLGEKRPFDARARGEVLVWELRKEDFEHLLAVDPAAAVLLRHELRRTLREPAERRASEQFNPAVVAGEGVEELARHLAEVARRGVCILDLRSQPAAPSTAMPPEVRHQVVGDISGKQLKRRLTDLLTAGNWVLLAVSAELSGALLNVVDQVKVVLDLTGQDLPWLIAASRRRWAVPPAQARYDRLARRLAGRTVGLALSGGMARGLAHIGVLRVLQEAGVPVDMIAGSGMGAVCGGLYAAGVPLSHLERLACGGRLNPLLAPSWRRRLGDSGAPFSNRSARQTVADLVADLNSDALPTPFYSVAVDLTSRQTVVLDQGQLVEALSAALSPPGLTPALKAGGRLLADGAPLNPLPSDVLERQGANLILASSVIPGQEAESRRSEPTPDPLGFAGSLLGLYDALAQPVYLDRIGLADLVLAPSVEAFKDTAFDRAGEIIQRGEQVAREHLATIRQLLGA
jgi:predicted acylesterase/phospholipase RssA/CRP-like cAMP-binding protein